MPEQTFHNRKELMPRRRELRQNATVSETQLWKFLRSGYLLGKKFRRQHSMGPFIVDFYCASENLVIELDGATHLTEETQIKDKRKEDFITAAGYTVLRFTDDEVCHDIDKVLEEIVRNFTETSP